MGVSSYNHDRIKVDTDRPGHLYSARIHSRKSLDARRIVARSYFRSLQTKLETPLEGTEQGPEGQGCWYEAEPEFVETQQQLAVFRFLNSVFCWSIRTKKE